jgi:crotonobetainyl-CoA:carnitine CoA-transferase CaiB-like acyl-CoA transferase
MTQPVKKSRGLPLGGIRVVEFTHMVMGPTCGMILGDLGAEVIKVEPVSGDKTRKLLGLGAGFFRTFNRNKKSFAVDTGTEEGLAIAKKLAATADVISENFKPGKMDELGLGYEALSRSNPKLIYVSHKGFLPGPYEHRTALDEVVQMMGGLAYMTGPPGRPLRAGTSVNDIMGGMWGVIGVLAALAERQRTGRGQHIQSSLFENCVFLSAQHMQAFAVTGTPVAPMPVRQTSWGIYDIFQTSDHRPVFIGAVSDGQWKALCRILDLGELEADVELATNNGRVMARSQLLPIIEQAVAGWTFDAICDALEKNGLPFAPVNRPEDLFDDPHLKSGGLAKLRTENGEETLVPMLPVQLGERRLGDGASIPSLGNGTQEVLKELGYSRDDIARLAAAKTVAMPSEPAMAD